MPKDFAAPRKTSKANRKSSPPEAPSPRKPVPGWIWSITAVLAIAFAGVLYLLTQVKGNDQISETSTPAVTEQEKPSTPATQQASKPAPKHRESLEFYKILSQPDQIDAGPQNNVRDSRNPEVQSKTAYLLQAASFRKKKDADQLRAELILKGLTDAYVESIKMKDNSIYYRVMVGPIKERSKMARAKDIMVRAQVSPIERKITLDK